MGGGHLEQTLPEHVGNVRALMYADNTVLYHADNNPNARTAEYSG